MSVLDKIASTIMPPETAEQRAEARRKAESMATSDTFLRDILDHHRQIERAFEACKTASDAGSRTAALKELATILSGHANAEEVAIYPMVADQEAKRHAAMAYQEQAMTKMEMGKLEMLEPMSQEWIDKLEHIEGAVKHHMYEEEGTWFPELIEAIPQADQAHVTMRFREEFNRYMGGARGGAANNGQNAGRRTADAQELA